MKTSAIFLIPALLLSGCNSPEPKSEPLNILMIAIDDMNNWIGTMQHMAETPHIDDLAQSGILFDNAFCVVPSCNGSRVALMTGLRPETTGQYGNAGNFRDRPGGPDLLTMPQYFREHGYEAVAAGKIYHWARGNREEPAALSDPASWNWQRTGRIGTPGIELYQDEDERAAWLEGDWRRYIDDPDGRGGMHYLTEKGVWGGISQPKEECGDWQTAEFCAQYLSEEHEKPFFLACGIFRPHMPLLAPQEYFDRYPLESLKLPEIPEDDMEDIPEIAKRNSSSDFVDIMREKGEYRNAVRAYKACMAFADDCVAHVVNALENSQYADNTIVIFWTDHGWQLGHKNRWEKFTLWHQSTNSPLVIRYPGMENAGKVCSEEVSFLDLYPTLLDLAGLPGREILEGETLLPWLEDPALEKETPAIITNGRNNHSVVWKNWNYIRYRDGSEELYNHDTDSREYRNLADLPEHRDLMDRLKAMAPSVPPNQ